MNLDLPLARDLSVRPVELDAGGRDSNGFVGTATPALCWQLQSDRQEVSQRAFQIQICAQADFRHEVTETAQLPSARLKAPSWPFAPLVSRQVCWLRVRVWTDVGVTDWSNPLRIEAALLDQSDWQARPVSPHSNCDLHVPGPVPLLRYNFSLEKEVRQARLYVTALGIHESWINGTPIGDELLEPGWTAYRERLAYAAHDVTALLRPGENVLAAAVGDGWWRGWLTWMERRALYGITTAYLAQLEISFADGTGMIVKSDEQWRGSTGAMREADLYNGCSIDLRCEQAGWRQPDFDDHDWEAVATLDLPAGLELRTMPPVRIIDRWPVAPQLQNTGRWLVDVGQNLAGYLHIRVKGHRGAQISVRHAEVLDDDGALYTAPLRNARASDHYVLSDDAWITLAPSFTFHGFRYAEIEADEGVDLETVHVCALSSDLHQIGHFECSDSRVNKLFENVRWSQLGNFLALPTDCPQRDERLGWTGDIQVFAETACTNAQAASFLGSWLKDLAIEQREDGNVPSTVPNVIGGHEFEYGGVGWGDAATLVPWAIYQAYGDIGVLTAQFDSMRGWVDWGLSRLNSMGVWTCDFHLGDWLDPGAPSDQPEKATTDPNFIATAYLSHSAGVVAATADLLGHRDLAQFYRASSKRIARAAWSRWRNHARRTQAGCAMAIEFAIAPVDEIDEVGRCLAALVDRNGGRIGTGFLGTPLVLPALSRTGQINAAYRLLLNETCPGWMYQVKRGATTMWERWDAVHEDGSLHAGEMSSGGGSSMISFNHYAYGAVACWLYRTVAGIAPDPAEPGYRYILFAPQPGGGLSRAEAWIDTPLGRSGIAWTTDEARMEVDLTIAPGAQGRFQAPKGWSMHDAPVSTSLSLRSGSHRFILHRMS